jgi:hypothetical protein
MKALVVYYSLTGTARAVATALARELGADIDEIRCKRYAPGFSGYVRAGFDSWRGNLPPIEPLSRPLSLYDLVVVGGPIWAAHPATPLRAFLRQRRSQLPSVAFFLTHGGSAGERPLGELQSLAGIAARATLVVREADVKNGSYASAVSSLAAKLRQSKAA